MKKRPVYLPAQRGLSLVWVAVLMAGLAAAAMAALFSMHYERNLFAEGMDKALRQAAPAAAALPAMQPAAGPLRKCRIGGTTVVSNVDCSDHNPTSKPLELHPTHGVEPPRVPAPAAAPEAPATAREQMIEKATR